MALNKKLPVQVIDAGKFLHQINIGAQSQIVVFEDRVKLLGKELGANWSLASVDRDSIFIEDCDDAKYYQASVENLGKGKIKIHNLRELKIVEASTSKENIFGKNLVTMVEAISQDRIKEADETFNQLARQKFSSRIIPEHGYVTTRDGVTRVVHTSNTVVSESDQEKVIKAVADALKGGVKINRGGIIEATFHSKQISIPITELTRKKVIANDMREVAKHAYTSEGFQNRIKHIASLMTKGDMKGAVQSVSEFTTENQEFCLLTEEETQELVSNTLAANLCFNKALAEDTGTLFYRTCCRTNRDAIISEWRKTARMTEYAPFVSNVRTLEESKNFEESYGKFLKAIFTESAKDRLMF